MTATERQREILKKAAATGDFVEFKAVKELYTGANPSGDFHSDLKRLKKQWEEFIAFADIFGIPLPLFVPKLSSSGKSLDGLRINCRPFQKSLNKDQKRRRRKHLAIAAVHHCLEGSSENYLIPRSNPTFWGIGSTVYYAFQEMVNRQLGPQSEIWTASFEIAKLFYLTAAEKHDALSPITLLGCRLNWEEGCVVPEPNQDSALEHFDSMLNSAVISFDIMNNEGQIFSKSSVSQSVTNHQLKRVLSRIVIIADHSKMGLRDQSRSVNPISIPDGPDVFLVTDEPLPSSFKPPGRATVITIEKTLDNHAAQTAQT